MIHCRIGLLFLAVTMLSGCNVLGGPKATNIKQSIIERTPTTALKQIKLSDYGEGDSVLYFLEKGMLQKMAGQLTESAASFEQAKNKMEALYTASVTQGIGSVLLNDNVTDYEGEPYEMIMAHVNQALIYLEQGNAENAAVIARQMDTKLNQLAEKKSSDKDKVYNCDPFSDYLSGLIFETVEDWSSARITYQRALKCYESGIVAIEVPEQLKRALIRSAKYSEATDEFNKYKKKFKIKDVAKPNSELIFVLDEGFVVAKREHSTSITAVTESGPRQLKIAMPEYPKNNPHLLSKIRLTIDGKDFFAEKVHDLDSVARIALSERIGAIQARAVARAVKNQAIQNEADQKGGMFAKFAAVIATNVIENADVRGWESLPHTIWMARKELSPGTYDIKVELLDVNDNVLNRKQYNKIKLADGKKKSIYLRWGATAVKNNNKDKNVNLFIF